MSTTLLPHGFLDCRLTITAMFLSSCRFQLCLSGPDFYVLVDLHLERRALSIACCPAARPEKLVAQKPGELMAVPPKKIVRSLASLFRVVSGLLLVLTTQLPSVASRCRLGHLWPNCPS
ncbi:uncharacterized protein BO97DRAFT_167335 [Aspergillus homomorphus CBS 101889]|uniref:Uncharacterized protein n=1 Tax=Aspergillus homomorphus (strain CBS 101889) TaxID=1450537 RepID=A0A395HRT9_ASPHC|nr:hypothetical protein BO97DRAFT_167335 [Aspergillus homomorphus CBS 101889]RAL09568.1 hypothetical protein BO97DRAFT_167335 [Aspergillus homomorphus CBS 101889]